VILGKMELQLEFELETKFPRKTSRKHLWFLPRTLQKVCLHLLGRKVKTICQLLSFTRIASRQTYLSTHQTHFDKHQLEFHAITLLSPAENKYF
jgi:hypothetical protein